MSLGSDYAAIQRLIYRHGHIFDYGKWEEYLQLYRHAEWYNPGAPPLSAQGLLDNFRRMIVMHDGSPRTHHLMHNPLIDVAPDGRTASATTTVQVLQSVPPAFPMQTILVGHYKDEFAKDEGGEWHFTKRETHPIFWGDVSQHAKATSGGYGLDQ
ncbi:hypothetical protein CaCOL14_006113 [Colletotrichum acutatum]|uniref:SnoaL-like domain-containing protein n=1 Tax=Glomerella acutata TaxID=27357 RepID=A0AAD8XFD3_GLOAC|nr:uncharacterized protein BDZ83DRAFT_632181 [Colletotrichum acutatum]KAK1719426.1 hypothetical protein BDZ83DRAFT_632181 [Colletotrichum acutatum]